MPSLTESLHMSGLTGERENRKREKGVVRVFVPTQLMCQQRLLFCSGYILSVFVALL